MEVENWGGKPNQLYLPPNPGSFQVPTAASYFKKTKKKEATSCPQKARAVGEPEKAEEKREPTS